MVIIMRLAYPRGADVLRITDFILLACRLLLAGVFLLAGATKLVDPLGLRRALTGFGVPLFLTRPGVLVLPLAEIVVALALIPASLAWYGAWGALALLVIFLLAIGVAMVRGRKPDCHCFGQLHSSPVGRATLVRNVILAAGAAWLVSRTPANLGPDVWTWYDTLGVHSQKAALAAACLMGFFFLWLVYQAKPQPASAQPAEIEVEEEEPDAMPIRRTVKRVEPARPAPESEPAAPAKLINNIGLPIGTPAPEFELPGIHVGKGSLQSLRKQGHDVLLVFSSPYCPPCQALAPSLARWTREMEQSLNIVVISRGGKQDNLSKMKELDNLHVLLQPEFEVAEAYDCNTTPAAVLVGADGLIRSELAVGKEAIQALISGARGA
jgi:peroxiredoxin/uncharacterized membrane protein YphA (DoxX/SURF4 family)